MSSTIASGQTWEIAAPPPQLGRYHYVALTPGQVAPLAGTAMRVTAYPLSHAAVQSSAFVVETDEGALLYLGDTGPDEIEPGQRLHALWQAVTPLLRAHRLRGILLECSYDDSRPDALLFGHLSPRWFMTTLHDLRSVSGMALSGMPVIVSHIKPSISGSDDTRTHILHELAARNDLGVRLLAARQGQVIHLP